MKLGIKYKLLFAFLITTIVVVGTMFYLMYWSFERGFLQYVNTVELEAHNNLVDELEKIYIQDGGWEKLSKDMRLWHRLHYNSFTNTRAMQERMQPEDAVTKNGPAMEFTIEDRNLPPPPRFNRQFGDRYGAEHLLHRHPDNVRSHFKTRTVLLDKNKDLVIGRLESLEDIELKPINVDNQLVGYLGIQPIKALSDTHDLRFSKQQGNAFAIIAIAMVIISLIMTLPLSRQLVRPIQSLTDATRRLAAGNYETRIEVSSNDELGRLSRDFNTLAKTLEKNEKARRQWIADISHELRTPLAILRGEIEALQDGIRESTPERLGSLHGEVMNLNRLIEDLYELSLSDIGALSYHKKPVNLYALLDSTVAVFRDEFEDRNISIEVQNEKQGAIMVFADPDRLQQLFSNLLINSLRYTDAGGQLRIILEHSIKNAVLQFMDSAPGVGEDDLPNLFDRFYRIDPSRTRRTGGTGLGLAICKNIIEAHEGSIVAGLSPLGGVLIRIDLPVMG